jgi:hypothetical protein
MVVEIIVNLIASVTLLFLGYSFERIKIYFKTRSIRHIWKPFLNSKDVSLILSTRAGPYERSIPRISLLEMQGYVNISKRLSGVGIEVVLKDSQVRIKDIRDKDLIVLGGPVANDVSKEIWELISPEIPFSLEIENQVLQMTDKKYEPVIGNREKFIKDYGIIIRQPQPFNPERTLLFCMGCHGFATYGATLYTTEFNYVEKLADAVGKKNNFVALLEFDIQNDSIASSKIVHCYTYTELPP